MRDWEGYTRSFQQPQTGAQNMMLKWECQAECGHNLVSIGEIKQFYFIIDYRQKKYSM